jgi:MFS transporter, ACS family, glucarate transporter
MITTSVIATKILWRPKKLLANSSAQESERDAGTEAALQSSMALKSAAAVTASSIERPRGISIGRALAGRSAGCRPECREFTYHARRVSSSPEWPKQVKYQHRVLGMLSLLAMITYLDRVCIGVAGPRMQDDLHLSPQQWGWVSSLFYLSYAVFEIPAGALGDRVGPRRVLTRIVTWWSACTSLTGLVSGYPLLLLVRFCFGVGEAGAYPNIAAVIGRWIAPLKRARAMGIVWMTSQVGAAFAPLLVVPIQMRYGWRASFFVFGVLGVAWSVVWYVWFRDSPREMPGITASERREIGADPPVRHGGLPWGLALRSGALWRTAGIAACYVYALSFFQSWLQTYLVKGRGFTEAALVLSTLPYLLGAVANLAGGYVSDVLVQRHGLRSGRRTVGVLGLSVAAVFMGAAIMAPTGGWALLFLSLSYAGILFQQPVLCVICLDIGGSHGGTVFGFMNTVGGLASTLSSVTFGYLVAYFGSYDAPFFPMLALLCLGTGLWLTVDPTQVIVRQAAAGDRDGAAAPPVALADR